MSLTRLSQAGLQVGTLFSGIDGPDLTVYGEFRGHNIYLLTGLRGVDTVKVWRESHEGLCRGIRTTARSAATADSGPFSAGPTTGSIWP